jgi:hypothetical protein
LEDREVNLMFDWSKPLFRLPKWLKPEINVPKYWVHLGVIAVVALGILQYLQGGNMLTWQKVLVSIPLLGAGDIVAHTILQLD